MKNKWWNILKLFILSSWNVLEWINCISYLLWFVFVFEWTFITMCHSSAVLNVFIFLKRVTGSWSGRYKDNSTRLSTEILSDHLTPFKFQCGFPESNIEQVWEATYSAQYGPQGWRKSLDRTGGLIQQRSSSRCPPRPSGRCLESHREGSVHHQSHTLSPLHQSTAGGERPLHPNCLWGVWLEWKRTGTHPGPHPDLQEVRRKAWRHQRHCDSACWLESSPG